MSPDDQAAIALAVRAFVDREVIPSADALERRDEYPAAIVEGMKRLGLFGLMIPPEHGGLGASLETYALCVAELARGWMSLSGILNTHYIAAWLLGAFGTDEQRGRYLPRMATGELRAALSMSEAHAGSDLRAIRCRAARDAEDWIVDGDKMWVTNGLRAGLVMLLVRTPEAARSDAARLDAARSDAARSDAGRSDAARSEAAPPDATPSGAAPSDRIKDAASERRASQMSVLIIEKTPGVPSEGGLTVGANIPKLGYRGIETTDLAFCGHRVPQRCLLGGVPGRGLSQVLSAIEVGRVNVAARALGVGRRAFEESIRYAQERETFGKPIAEHQAIQFKLAEMATKLAAARLLVLEAARKKDAGERSDLESGMAKLFASEACVEVVTDALRIHGGAGYSTAHVIERLYRDAPFLLIGEGTSEIQKLVIARQLLERHRID